MEPADLSFAFSRCLLDWARADERVCIVVNDSAETHGAVPFAREFPERFVDVGIAEQNLVDVAVGMANAGLLPFVHSAACFLTGRALEQIKLAAYMDAQVHLCGFVSGMAYGALGGTHHAVEDVAWVRAIPNVRIASPATPRDVSATLDACIAEPRITYLRIGSKLMLPELFTPGHQFHFGEAHRFGVGQDVTLVASGAMTATAVRSLDELRRIGIEGTVLHLGSIVPLDRRALRAAAERTGTLVVIEDHQPAGGLFGAVAEALAHERCRIEQIGLHGEFAPVGPAPFLYEHFCLTPVRIAERVQQHLEAA